MATLQLCTETSWKDQLDGPAGHISWTDQLDGPAGRTCWADQLDGPAGQTSSFYLKPWPVRIFKDFPFSLCIVAASESDEGLVCLYFLNNVSGILDTTDTHFLHPWGEGKLPLATI